MCKKYIVILKASGISSNNEIEELLKNNVYNIITFPILKVDSSQKPINP